MELKDEKPKYALPNSSFTMSSREILEEKVRDIRGRASTFKLAAGPLLRSGEPMTGKYALEIDYFTAEQAHKMKVGEFIEGATLHKDYSAQAHLLVDEFCRERDFVVYDLLASWPNLQVIIEKKQ